MKKTYRQTGTVGGGYHEVHFRWTPPPRFAWKAWRQLRPKIEAQMTEAFINSTSPWFEAKAA
jgi:hypothetical protein